MESPYMFLLVALILVSSNIHRVQANRVQAQKGFISLDCGLSPNEHSPYTEPVTGLKFSSDSSFIQSGKIDRIDPKLESGYPKSKTTLRYFPDGIRNCYSLSVHQGTNYLIRVTSNYGNYDGLNIPPRFDLYIGPNYWVTIDLAKRVNSDKWEEIIHFPKSNSLDVCLLKTGTSTPIISSLELRPLPDNTYTTESSSLKSILRFDLTESTKVIRYPNDIFDRIWDTHFEPQWTQISTVLEVNISNRYSVPKDVLMTAAIPANANAPFSFTKNLEFPNDKLYMYFHFAEVQALQANQIRAFTIFWNRKTIFRPLSPMYLKDYTVFTYTPSSCEVGKCLLEIKRTQTSTLPPLLSAIEFFAAINFTESETNEDDVIAMKNIKATYGLSRISWQGDPCVPRQFLWDGLGCTDTNVSTPPRITSLNLSSSGLTGSIAPGIQNLTNLQNLDLSNNNLTGKVPEFLANMKSLLVIDLRNNKLDGSIPNPLRDRSNTGLQLFVDGNGMCLSSSCVPDKKFPVMIVALASSALLVVAVVLILFFMYIKKKRSSLGLPPMRVKSTSISGQSIETQRRRFTYSEVVEMTKNFQKTLGEEGFGIMYHGYLNGSEQVAVKFLSQSSSQGYKHFKAELQYVELLLRVHHVNLVSLVGYCDEGDHLALIYECMSNGDLKDHLSGKHGQSVLKWSTRLRIAVDAALGLEYLHYGCRPLIVHRDVKSTNILLDDQFMAKIADFGLSRSFLLGEESQASTVVAGTLGYLDPEYYSTCRLSETSDVYSFGILLLEIITNQPVIDHAREKAHITEWVAFVLKEGDISRIVDPNLHGEYNSRSVSRALQLAMICANPSSEKRPNMSQVITELKESITENSMKCIDKMDSNSSLELSSSFDTKVVPSAR
ncbi:PREDICTED: putative receptor-like protein kinase At3g46340 [Camelina sativa]|uniref:non-specific serine/threonine protein kinase n=1 Tax=Camelina sativa TaxID=90675 RepID=A0ABM1RLF7_CAMSA|nr:PREDICTED: putative receptor-like protein kinase At3g46340 [Camelina sativa]